MPFVLLLVLSVVGEWLPVHIGDRWVYDEQLRSGSKAHPNIQRWTQEETTVAIEDVPQGALVRRKVRVLSGLRPDYLGPVAESNVFMSGKCIYYLNDSPSAGYRLDLSTVLKSVLPDACFPFYRGQMWGDPKHGREHWAVKGLGQAKPDDPRAITPSSWRCEANLSSGDDNYFWFQKGIGMVAQRTYHNGTYFDFQLSLLSFQHGARRE